MEKWSVKVKLILECERIVELFAETKEDAEKYAIQTLYDCKEENDIMGFIESDAVRHIDRKWEIGIRAK